MKGKRFIEGQIIKILQEAETGVPIADLCRKHNCSEQSFYRWKNKYSGVNVSEAKRLKEFEWENSKLKKMVAEQALDIRPRTCAIDPSQRGAASGKKTAQTPLTEPIDTRG